MDDEATTQSETGVASQACAPCRRQKRKCDKQLPACGLCLRLNRTCDYTVDAQPTPPTTQAFEALRQQVADLQDLIALQSTKIARSSRAESIHSSNGSDISNRASSSSNTLAPSPPPWSTAAAFPSLFFLDSTIFEHERCSIPTPFIKVPSAALASLGSSVDLREIIERFFATVHTYFPVISKIRLYQILASPMHEPDATVALLFLSMKLVCDELPDSVSPHTQLYQDVKSLYQYVEAQNGLNMKTIQALVLIALYETGHGIYPAAYLTIGNAARVGYAVGVHDKTAPQMLPRTTTWTEQEERRRLWWGIVILDRFIRIGNRGKPFATAEPSIETHLPADDAAWDRGQMLAAAPISLSASPSTFASPFARTCQAAHILGKTLRHIDDKSIPLEYRFEEASQLNRTMRAFAEAVLYGDVPENSPPSCGALFTSLAITYSGLLTLYDSYSCTSNAKDGGGESQLFVQKESIDGLSEISERVIGLAQQLRGVIERGKLQHVNPMAIDCVYQAAANYAWYVRESSDATYAARLQELKQLLSMLDQRWKIAGEYYRIVEAWQTHPLS